MLIRFPSIIAAVASGLDDTIVGFTQVPPLTRRKCVQSEFVVIWMRTLPFEGVAAITGALVTGTAVGRGMVVAAAVLICEGATVGLDGELQLANAIIKTQVDVTINFDMWCMGNPPSGQIGVLPILGLRANSTLVYALGG